MRITSIIVNIIAAVLWIVNTINFTRLCISNFNFGSLLMLICSLMLSCLHIIMAITSY